MEKSKAIKKPIKKSVITKIDHIDDIDSRARFYKLMSQNSKDHDTIDPDRTSGGKPLNLYKRLAIKFLILAVILFALVFYFSVIKLTIIVNPQTETLNDSFIVPLCFKDECRNLSPETQNALSAKYLEEGASDSNFFDTVSMAPAAESFTGTVKIINRHSASQALVKTTRLLSPDNKLYRLKNTVMIPAGSEVIVDVYPDQNLPEMALGSTTTFIIPGLRPDLQNKIYAESIAPFSYSQSAQKMIAQSDIDSATKALEVKILEKYQSLHPVYDNFDHGVFTIADKSLEFKLDGSQKGDRVDNFTAHASGTIKALYFSDKDLRILVQKRVESILATGQALADIDYQNMTLILVNVDSENGLATLQVDYNANAYLNRGNLIDAKQLVNLNQSQIESYLRDTSGVKDFSLKFSPSFLHKAPCLADRIMIEFK